MRERHELRARIAILSELGERLDKVDYCGRLWLADYAAHADIIADCMRELLNGSATLPDDDADATDCDLCSATFSAKEAPRCTGITA